MTNLIHTMGLLYLRLTIGFCPLPLCASLSASLLLSRSSVARPEIQYNVHLFISVDVGVLRALILQLKQRVCTFRFGLPTFSFATFEHSSVPTV